MNVSVYLWYLLGTIAVVWALKQSFDIFEYKALLMRDHPECMTPNPNMLTLVIGTLLIQICLQIPVQRVSKQLFMISLP